MPTPEEIHAQMQQGYAKQRRPSDPQQKADETHHIRERLDPELFAKFHSYMESRGLTAKQALHIIVSKFFH